MITLQNITKRFGDYVALDDVSIEPESGCSSPAMIRSNVDLPPPLGPSNAVSEPGFTSTVTSSSALKSP